MSYFILVMHSISLNLIERLCNIDSAFSGIGKFCFAASLKILRTPLPHCSKAFQRIKQETGLYFVSMKTSFTTIAAATILY
jgi:hypothetical protein